MSTTSDLAAPLRPRASAAAGRVTYARARLKLGITGVGSLVVLASLLLALDAPARLLPDGAGWRAADAAVLAGLVALYVAASAGFDRLGGAVLPARHGRYVPRPYAAAWARGVAVHAAVLLAASLALLAAGRAGGLPAAAGAGAALVVALLLAQERLARLGGGVRRDAAGRLVAADDSFVGGVTGLPGRERVLTPASWGLATAEVQLARRSAVVASGSRALGVLVAAGWTVGGLALALWLAPGSADSVAAIATASLWATLWSFLGVLVLPSLSRRAVLLADRAALEQGVPYGRIQEVLRELDARQEDEPARSRLVETVFHPVPSLDRRLAALAEAATELEAGGSVRRRRVAPWHAARTALFLSSASLGLLSRAVHCNSGRPELWALYPGD